MHPEHMRLLGIQRDATVDSLPLHTLSSALAASKDAIPRTSCGLPVVPFELDPYCSSFVAPDHLLAGLASDIISAACVPLPRPLRDSVNNLICRALASSTLPRERSIFCGTGNMHSMPLSNVLSVLLVAPFASSSAIAVWNRASCARKENTVDPAAVFAVDLLQMFHSLVANTYATSRYSFDISLDMGDAHIDELLQKAKQYFRGVDELCTMSLTAKKLIDKSNLHRLLELYSHSLPAFRRITNLQELIFEKAHQPLKRAVQSSIHKCPQLDAMFTTLADDWETRLSFEVIHAGSDPLS